MRNRPLTLTVYTADAWEHVCPVVRITAPAREAGIDIVHGNEWLASPGRTPDLRLYPARVADGDLVVIQRDFPCVVGDSEISPYEQVMGEARRLGKRVVYELDDLLPELPPEHPGSRRYLPGRLAILRAIVEADIVVGSTPYICEYLGQFNNRVLHLPNYLDDRFWKLRQAQPEETRQGGGRGPLVIGYLGSASHLSDLAMVLPVLQRLLERYGNRLILRFWGLTPPHSLCRLPNVEWNPVGLVDYGDFARFFSSQDCDLAIAPLQDNVFNRGKSPIKFLEYSALGIPGVYSRLDPYTQVVKDGENGLLAGSLEEWEAQMADLIENDSLRGRLGEAAQETVRRDWMLSNHADAWAEKYRSVLASPAAGSAQHLHAALIKAQVWQQELESSSREMALELAQRVREYSQATAVYQDLVNSSEWKIFQKLGRLQKKLAPPGSWRDRLLHLGFYSLLVLRREGLKGSLRGGARKIRSSFSTFLHKGQGAPASLPAVFPSKTVLLPGATGQTFGRSLSASADGRTLSAHGRTLSAISLVIANEPGWPSLEDTLAWLQGQTIEASAVEVVTWDHHNNMAESAGNPASAWSTANAAELANGLQGRYLCLAYPDLLQQNSSFLEANWIALESGSLAFTVNVRGACAWADGYLDAGFLPGRLDQALYRLVIDKTCLKGEIAGRTLSASLQWDVSAWTGGLPQDQSGFPWVAGRVIRHTSQEADVPGILTFSNRLPTGQWRRQDTCLLWRPVGDGPWPDISTVVHPIQRLSPEPEKSGTSPDRPTVLVALQYLAVGGAEQLALNIIKELNSQIRFVVFSIDPMDKSLPNLADAFRQVTPYVYTPADFLEPEQRLSFYFSLRERFKPVSLYIANGAESIYADLAEIKKRYPGLRTINQVYDSQVGWINFYNLRLLKHLDAHIGANSQICQAYLAKGARPDSVFEIPHTIDLDSLDPRAYPPERLAQLRKDFAGSNSVEGIRIVVFASRAHPQKRPLDFVEMARRFMDISRNDQTIHFLMFSEGPLAEQIDAAIDQVNAGQQTGAVRRLPFHRPISDVLAAADVLVLPSEFEGMPLVAAEAQAMGKPVVVTDVGNNREVLALTGGGVVVPVGDVQALYLGVQQMLAQPPDPIRLRQAISDHFSPRAVAERYRQVLLGKENRT